MRSSIELMFTFFYFQDINLIFRILFSNLGTVEVLAYPSLRPLDTLMAHTAGCYCIAIDPSGRYTYSLCGVVNFT